MPQIVFVSDDAVHPVTSGGRLELLGELRALSAAGIVVHLVAFHREAVPAEDQERTSELVASATFVPRRGFVASTLRDPLHPFQLSSRSVSSGVVTEVIRAAQGRVDAVLASHEWTLPAAQRFASAVGDVPILLRSHNDEAAYYQSLAEHATGAKRLYLRGESRRIDRALRERSLWRGVIAAAVISPADGEAYARVGVPVSVIPPTFDTVAPHARDLPLPDRSIGFVGALDSSHTEQGLRWFVDEVFAALHGGDSSTRLVVAGRRASPLLRGHLEQTPGVVFLGEVDDPATVYERARIFVNPIFSGSGVNMKIGPPIAHGLPVVTTTVGARGLSTLRPALTIADDASTMRRRISMLLRDDALCHELSRVGTAVLRSHRPETTGLLFRDLLADARQHA
ncbi:glycosyltransferase [Microbacterium testaceum]|uniref:glycosyltransferase n=1 Tax=Microbacterium testaceum TaxID=2033 RepID=UPI00177DB3FE|nr:glycosyltransferase [Microbacterium testaceum]